MVFWPRHVEGIDGKSMFCRPVCCRKAANELLCWRDSFASIHRMMSWFIRCNSVMYSARSSRHCWRGLGVVVMRLEDAI